MLACVPHLGHTSPHHKEPLSQHETFIATFVVFIRKIANKIT